MPELPEVQGLVDFLADRAVGQAVTAIELGSFTVLKTFTPPPDSLVGRPVDAVSRHGKWIDIDIDGTHALIHLSKAGWLRWYDEAPEKPVRPGKSPIAVRVRLGDGSGFDLTEAGTRKRLALHLVADPAEVDAVASLGPDVLDPAFTREVFAEVLAGRRTQIKGVLRDQSLLAGVGNAYSDEVLHAARLSPYALAASLTDDEVDRLYACLRDVVQAAVDAASGKPAAQLKDAKRAGMRVHGRAGEACGVCGDVVREVSFADRALQYCATCQTGGKVLADRRMSRLLR